MYTYIAFLRGINVGGHHKIPMSELRKEFTLMGFKKVETLLNSGNVIFQSENLSPLEIEQKVEHQLREKFGFPVPSIVISSKELESLLRKAPFKNITVTKDIRLYVSFSKHNIAKKMILPWNSSDKSFQILDVQKKVVLSILDLSISGSPKAMKILEQEFGKEVTTRNWNTLERIAQKFKLS